MKAIIAEMWSDVVVQTKHMYSSCDNNSSVLLNCLVYSDQMYLNHARQRNKLCNEELVAIVNAATVAFLNCTAIAGYTVLMFIDPNKLHTQHREWL